MRKFLLVASLLFIAHSASAQTVTGDRFRLITGPCVIYSGSGSPDGVVTANPCDEWVRTDTGQIYKKISGTGNTSWFPVLGATSATCSTFAGCVAASLTIDTTLFTQKLRTDGSFQFKQGVTSDGSLLQSFNGGGWMPLKLFGGPTQIQGGGLHVGQIPGTVDSGVGNALWDGWIHSTSPSYTSQTTGMSTDFTDGSIDAQYIYTNELHAKSFIADLEQALAGGQIISKSVAKIGAPFTVPAAGSISILTVMDLPSATGMAVFESGDFVRVRSFSRASGSLSITDAWGVVTGYTNLGACGNATCQTWNFQRAVVNGGAMAAGSIIGTESIVLDYGVSGNGFYEVNAIDGLYGVNSPYSQIVTWTGNSPISSNQSVRTRFGNLKGITGTPEFGLLAGTYAASNGQYFIGSDQRFELHGIDLKLWNGSQNIYRLDHTTPYESMGTPAPTSFTSGTGCWSGLDAGVFKWRCGDIAGGTNYISWNGTQLTVSGNIVIVGTSIDAASVLGVPGATINSGAARGLLGIDSNGNPLLPHTATPSGSGLFLGADFMGYFASGVWKTFMDNTGGFYLGGTGGSLQWNGTSLTINGTLSGPGSGITSINGGNITTGTINASTALISGTVTAAKMAANSVTAASILAGTITGTLIANGTITTNQIAAGTILASNIAANTITASQIAAGTITASQIAAGTITSTQINTSTLTALGAVTAGTFNLGSGKFIVDGSGFLTASLATMIGLSVSGSTVTDSITQTGTGLAHFASFDSLAGSGNVYVCATNTGLIYAGIGGC